MIGESTEKCKICGRPYKFYPFSAADQSACPRCVRSAETAVRIVTDVRTVPPFNFVRPPAIEKILNDARKAAYEEPKP